MRKLFSSSNNFWSCIVVLTMMMVAQSARAEYVKLTALAGIDAWSGVAETHEKLVDANINTRWGCWFDPSLSDEDSWPTNSDNSSNICYIIVKAEKAVNPEWYFLVTGHDTGSYPGRNWASWKIYGGNFESDEQAVRGGEGWTLLDDKQDEPLPAANFASTNLQFDYAGTETFQYFWIEVEKTVADADVYQQMSEWGLGTFESFQQYFEPINFVDANVKAICVDNWDTNGDGELSYAEAAAVTDLGTVFRGNTTITSFNELQYFTGLEDISDWAFRDCSGLTSVTIPNGVTSIGKLAFFGCSGLTSITIPNSVTSIGADAFWYCTGLTSITIPNSVTSIGDYAFYSCNGLTSITIPNSVTSIGAVVFQSCTGLTSIIVESENLVYMSKDGVLYNKAGTTLITYPAGKSNTSYTIPNSVTSIEADAFYACWHLTSITIPNSVTSIGNSAFYGCWSLTSITIPNSVTSIGENPFEICGSLTSISVASGNTVYDSRNDCNAIIETASNTLIVGCQNSVIPNSVTSIGNAAFNGCSELASVTIPNSVTSIGNRAFQSCAGLTTVTIPNSVTCIGYCAFQNCVGLTSVTIPNSVTSIGYSAFNRTTWIESQPDGLVYAGKVAYEYKGTMPDNTEIILEEGTLGIAGYAFSGCSGLTSITIPNSVTSIGESAFYGCSGLTSVTVLVSQPLPITESTFSHRANATLFVPAGSKAAYEAADYWKDFKEIIDLGQSIAFADANVKALCVANWDTNSDGELSYEEAAAVTDLGEVFRGNTTITSFDELQYFIGLTEIGEHAFHGCTGLTSITIPGSVTEIEYCAFHDCIGLTSITIPNNVTSIGPAFNGCNGLTSIFIPKNVTSIDRSFNACSSLESIVVEEGNTVYDSRNNCNALIETASNTLIRGCQNSIIPESITTIGFSAFTYCYGLTSITIPNSVTSIENSAFWDCSNLTSISIPNSVDNIGESSFGYCGRLESIVVEGGNTKYDSRNNCNALIETASNTLIRGCKNTIIPEGITTIGHSAFSACDDITSVTIPNSVTSIGDDAFGNCFSLTSITIPENVVVIDRCAFDACSALPSITIPNSVTSIGERAFSYCLSLTNVISEIEDPFAFGNGAFDNISNNCVLTVPAGTRDAYIAAGWTEDVFKGGIVEMMGTMTDISQMDNAIYVEPMEGKKDGIVPLEVKLKNAITPVGCSFKLRLPEGFSLVKDTDGDVIYEIGDRAKKMSVTMQDWNNGSFDFALTPSTGTATISGNDGTFITFSMKVPDDAVANQNYSIQLTNNLIQSKQDGVTRDTPLSDVRTILYVFDYILGDVNGDKNVTPADAIMILYHYFNVEQNGFNARAADLNDDGNITPADAIEALYLYFGVGNSNAVKSYMDILDDIDTLDPQ